MPTPNTKIKIGKYNQVGGDSTKTKYRMFVPAVVYKQIIGDTELTDKMIFRVYPPKHKIIPGLKRAEGRYEVMIDETFCGKEATINIDYPNEIFEEIVERMNKFIENEKIGVVDWIN